MLAKRGVAVGVLMFAVIVNVVLGLGRVSLAQTVKGTIHGTVTDATGAAIPDVSIQVTNLGNGLTRTAVANSSGFYTITELPPGQYSIKVSKTSFATVVQDRLELLVNQNLEANYTLKVGEVSERVEVGEAPPPLDTASATFA